MNLSSKEIIRTAGLMTGTSMDGLDIVITDISLNNDVHYQIINEIRNTRNWSGRFKTF